MCNDSGTAGSVDLVEEFALVRIRILAGHLRLDGNVAPGPWRNGSDVGEPCKPELNPTNRARFRLVLRYPGVLTPSYEAEAP